MCEYCNLMTKDDINELSKSEPLSQFEYWRTQRNKLISYFNKVYKNNNDLTFRGLINHMYLHVKYSNEISDKVYEDFILVYYGREDKHLL